jgi:hypothetical protein
MLWLVPILLSDRARRLPISSLRQSLLNLNIHRFVVKRKWFFVGGPGTVSEYLMRAAEGIGTAPNARRLYPSRTSAGSTHGHAGTPGKGICYVDAGVLWLEVLEQALEFCSGCTRISLQFPVGLFDHNDRKANPRMHGIDQEVLFVGVVNVVIVRIRPIRRPRIDEFKPVSRVLETWTILNQDDALHAELVIAAKVLAKSIVWNARSALGTSRSRSLGLCLMSISLSVVIFVLGASTACFCCSSVCFCCSC